MHSIRFFQESQRISFISPLVFLLFVFKLLLSFGESPKKGEAMTISLTTSGGTEDSEEMC